MSEDTKKSKRNIKPFDGEKYSIWKYRIRSLIAEEDALKVLDETDPTESDKLGEWAKSERIAKGIIIEYLSDSMLSFSTEADTAKNVMEKLDAIYNRKSLATQLAIEKKLLTLKFNETTSLSKHFICFDEMMVDLHAAGATVSEMSKIARLLLTLPNSYDALVTAIQTQADKDLTLAFVKIKLLDYEVKLQSEKTETSAKVLQTETIPSADKKNKKNKNFRGNFKKKQNNGFKNKKFNKNNKFKQCDHCGRRNHERKDCYFLKNNTTGEDNQRTLHTIQTQNEEQRFAFMSADQFKNKVSSDLTKAYFVIDSGATDHVVKDIDIFKTISTLEKPIKISIAKKGEVINATKIGTIEVKTNLGVTGVLENVLYVPEASTNLLSVSRIQQAGMSIIFGESGGVMVKRGGKTIFTGKSENNLLCVVFTIDKKMCNKTYANNIVALNAYKL